VLRKLKEQLSPGGEHSGAPALGPLETSVMDVMWRISECSVRDVCAQLERPLAYTTVMTTLDRLYKKGLLQRRKSERAFLYAARISRAEWERHRAATFLSGILNEEPAHRELILSCFVDAIGRHDATLLDELEQKLKRRRKELGRREAP